MKILVVGTGVIGTIYGWALAESGNEVVHYVREEKIGAFKDGIKIKMLDERKGHKKNSQLTYHPACVCADDVLDDIGLAIVPVNNYQLETVLGELSPKLKKAQFLIMTSNWNGTGVFDKVLSPDRYLLGYPDGGGTFQDGGMLANLGASIHLGEKDGRPSPRLQMLVDLLKKADMTPDVPPNILHWLWIHNATSATFYAGLCKYRDIRSFIKDGAMLSDCFIASKECLDLCRKRGVDIEKYDDISYFKYPIWVCTLIFRALFTFNKSMQVYTAHAASEGSKKEMRGNFMEIYNSGKSLGVPMPTMDKLYSIIASS